MMVTKKAWGKAAVLSGLSSAAMLVPGAAYAGGFYLQEQSVRGAGRAFSGEVADQGAASLWWNPASIGGLEGGDAHVGISAILPRGTVRDQGTVIRRPGFPTAQAPSSVGGNPYARNPIENGYLPTGAVAYGITPNVAVGLALSSPYSFATQYDADAWSRYNADRSMLRTYDIQPSVAVQFGGLSIGGAANIEYSKAYLSNYLPNATAAQDGYQALQGDGWDLGWSAGAQYKTGPLSVGVAYKSAIKHELKGTIKVVGLQGFLASGNRTNDASASFYTPWQLTFGGRLAVTDKLTLNAQASRIGWGKFDAIYLEGVGIPQMPEGYRNTWAVSTGFDLAVSPKLTLRSGVQYDQTPTRDGNRDPRVPDGNRWNFAGGASYKLGSNFIIDGAFNYINVNGSSVDRATLGLPTAPAPAQAPILTNGRLTNASVMIFSLGGRMSF